MSDEYVYIVTVPGPFGSIQTPTRHDAIGEKAILESCYPGYEPQIRARERMATDPVNAPRRGEA